jgi:murein L,D-transpeptidase YcbB/YkuD
MDATNHIFALTASTVLQRMRDLSHGCIRSAEATELAVSVLRDDHGWDVSRMRAAMMGPVKLLIPFPCASLRVP